MDIVFSHGRTPVTDAVPAGRACIGYDPDARKELVIGEWRGPELPYVVPPELRLPMEQLSGAPCEFGGCTEDVCRRVEQLVVNGSSVLAAKTVIGIGMRRWRDWKGYAKAGKHPFSTFMERMKLATAYVEATCTTTIHRASIHPDPKVAVPAAKLKLEHIAPERYAPRSTKRVEVHASMSIDVRHLQAIATMQPAQLVGMLRQIPAVGMREWTEAAAPIEGEVVGPGEEEDEG